MIHSIRAQNFLYITSNYSSRWCRHHEFSLVEKWSSRCYRINAMFTIIKCSTIHVMTNLLGRSLFHCNTSRWMYNECLYCPLIRQREICDEQKKVNHGLGRVGQSIIARNFSRRVHLVQGENEERIWENAFLIEQNEKVIRRNKHRAPLYSIFLAQRNLLREQQRTLFINNCFECSFEYQSNSRDRHRFDWIFSEKTSEKYVNWTIQFFEYHWNKWDHSCSYKFCLIEST